MKMSLPKNQNVVSLLSIILVSVLVIDPFNVLNELKIIALIPLVLLLSKLQFKRAWLREFGFRRASLNAKSILIYAPLLALVLTQLYEFVLAPLVTSITGQSLSLDFFESLEGNLDMLLMTLPFVWVSAAFGEELIFRGFLMQQFTKVFGSGTWATVLNIALFSVIFGWCHDYQGINGQILSGMIGATLALIYRYKKEDLWFTIMIHGFFDTIALLVFYFGWVN